jgi:hypothetical protein
MGKSRILRGRALPDCLSTPILRTHKLALALEAHGGSDDEVKGVYEDEAKRQSEEKLRKLLVLGDHLGIPFENEIDSWGVVIALALAEEFVEGFRVVEKLPRKRGRPKGSGRVALGPLVDAVDGLKARGKSVKNACQILSRKPEWKQLNAASLEARYYEQKRSAARLRNRQELAAAIIRAHDNKLTGMFALGASALDLEANFTPEPAMDGDCEK